MDTTMTPEKAERLLDANVVSKCLDSALEFMAKHPGSFAFPFRINIVVSGLRLKGEITIEPEPESEP